MSKTIEFGIKLRMDGREVDATLVGTREQFRQVGAAGQAAGQQVAAGMNAGTISAKQMQAALRGVPAQFTDIATALASGQNPMTVFLQQGGQLKDMFGGAGAAARALGGYVAGLVNPFTVAAAAIGGVGYAAYVANREVDGFRVALAAGGAALGVTVDELRAMTTQTNVSADALTAFVASGAVTRGSLAAITAEAVRFEDATGTAVDETVKRFQELGRAPVAAALKLNEQTHFLTAALYKQAAAMEAAGDKAGAARLLQEAYRAELQRIADTVEAALGPVASAWLGVERAIDGAWKATKRFLGGGDLAAQIADQQAKVAELQAVVDKGGDAFLRGKLGAAKQLLFVMQSQASLDAGTAQARREAYEATQKQIAHEQALADLMQRQSGVSKTFARDLRTLDAERESGRMSVEAYREAVKKLIATETDLGRASQRKHGESDFEKLRQALTAKTAAQEADAASAEKLNDTQRDYAKWLRMVTEGLLKLTPAEMRQAAALWDAALAAAAAADATAADRKANEEYVKAVEASEAAIHKEMDALRERAPVAQDELATYGKTKAAIEDLAIARLEEQLVMVDGWDSQEALANRLREEIALRKEYRNAVAGKESADMAARAAQDATRYWDRAAIDVGRSLADEIMRGGKSGGELLEDYFRTLVLQPSIQGVANVGMSAIGFGAPAGSGAAGTINAASNLSSLWGAFSGGTSYAAGSFAMSSVGQAMGLSSTSAAVPGMFVGDTAGAAGASLTGAGRTLSAAAPWIAAGLLAYNLFAGKSTPHRGGFATYSDAAGLTTGAATRGANRQLGGTGMRLDQFDASANSAAGNLAQGIATLFDNLGKSFGGATGYSVGTGFADDSSSDGAWGALRITDASGHDLTNWARGQRGGGPAFADGATGQAQYQRAVADSVLATLRDIDLPAWADNMLDALGSAPSLDKIVETADLITALKPVAGQLTDLGVAAENITPAAIAAAGGIDNLTATLAALPNINADANAAFEESRRASLSAASAYLESTERARQAASDWDGSLTSAQALGAAVQQRYQDELAYLQQVRDMVRTITADVAGAQNQYLLDTLDPAGKYDYYDRQMAAAMDMIRTSADPEVISDYAQRYLRAQGAAWQLLTPEQQRQYLPEFTADAADVGTLVTSRGGAIESSVRADNEAFATTLKDAVVEAIKEAFKPATDAITDAANTPTTSNVNVNVHISQDGSISVTAEPAVGGWEIGP